MELQGKGVLITGEARFVIPSLDRLRQVLTEGGQSEPARGPADLP